MPNLYNYQIQYNGSSKVIKRIVERLNHIVEAMLGTTHDKAFYGDWGNEAYEHSKLKEGNPHNVTLDDLGIADLPRQMALLNDILGFEDYWITHNPDTEYVIDHEDNQFVFRSTANILGWH